MDAVTKSGKIMFPWFICMCVVIFVLLEKNA